MRWAKSWLGVGGVLVVFTSFALGQSTSQYQRGEEVLRHYFAHQVQLLAQRCLQQVQSAQKWPQLRQKYRQQLLEMLGLWPLPPRTPLRAQVTGKIATEQFVVEKVHFQSMPGLYVTGNLYIPRGKGPFPAVLYVCGHSRVKKGNISYGNKVAYQHHGIWFAQNGYVCLMIDSLQLGEIEGLHHGTYGVRRGGKWHYRWWWFSLGYTPAGVEAWNCVRALDYLQSRPEVDPKRIGVTGRSGGGAYSWWITAIDPRIRVAVPVAGITDLEDHVVHGTVEGHCDCMFMVNTYRWDYPQVAALAAPRPLLIANTDKDGIFPLRGVMNVYWRVRRVYSLLGALDRVGLQISEGPHRDIQELQVAAFRWFDRFLQNRRDPVPQVASKLFQPEQLRVFQQLPSDQINTRVDHLFIRRPQARLPKDQRDWEQMCKHWTTGLKSKTFRGWPRQPVPLHPEVLFSKRQGPLHLIVLQFQSQAEVPLPVFVLARQAQTGSAPPLGDQVEFHLLGAEQWSQWKAALALRFPKAPFLENATQQTEAAFPARVSPGQVHVLVLTRGVGPTAWNPQERHHIQILRRFYLLGQTWEGMRTWDLLRTLELFGHPELHKLLAARGLKLQPEQFVLRAQGQEAALALYGALFFSGSVPLRLELEQMPSSHMGGPQLLNVLQVLDLPQTLALVAARHPVRLLCKDPAPWRYARQVAQRLQWPSDQLQLVATTKR